MKTITNMLSGGKVAFLVVSNFIPFIVMSADTPPVPERPIPAHGIRRDFGRRDTGMGMDDRQQQLFREALQTHREEMVKLDEQLRNAIMELVKATLADDYDEKVTRTNAEAIAKIQVKLMLQRCKALATVVPTLSLEQREELLANPATPMLLTGGLMDGRDRGMAPDRPGGEPLRGPSQPSDPLQETLFPPELLMRFQEQIGLTDEQRQAIMSELQQAQPKFVKLQQQLEKEKESLSALLQKERVELKPALDQADKLLEIEQELRRLQLTLQIELKNQLTPEQQEKLKDFKNQMPSGNPMSTGVPPSIQHKMQRLQLGIQQWQRDGQDPSRIQRAMGKFEPLIQAGQFEEAEAVLDSALQLLQRQRPR